MNMMCAGIIGKSAETKDVNGDLVTKFSVAVKERRKGDDGKPLTQWVECSWWGPGGEKMAQYLTVRSRVALTGNFHIRTYEKDGETRVVLEMRVSDCTLQGEGGEAREEKPAPAQKQEQKPRPRWT